MLTNSRIRKRCILSGFPLASREIFLRFNLIANEFWNVLSNSFFQSLARFTLRTHYCSGTSICIQYYFAYEQVKHPFEKKAASFLKRKLFLPTLIGNNC